MNNSIQIVKILSRIVCGISVLLAIPILGGHVDILKLPTIATIVLSIIILVLGKDINIKKTASILSITSGALDLCGSLILGYKLLASSQDKMDIVSILGILLIFASWILLIVATGSHFMNVDRLTQMETDITKVVATPTETVIIEEQVTITTDETNPTL